MRFVIIFRLLERGDAEPAMKQVQFLLDSQGDSLEQSIRRGDLFALLTQHYLNVGDVDRAKATIEELKRLVPSINLSYYYNASVLEALGYKVKPDKTESPGDDDIEELLGE